MAGQNIKQGTFKYTNGQLHSDKMANQHRNLIFRSAALVLDTYHYMQRYIHLHVCTCACLCIAVVSGAVHCSGAPAPAPGNVC